MDVSVKDTIRISVDYGLSTVLSAYVGFDNRQSRGKNIALRDL